MLNDIYEVTQGSLSQLYDFTVIGDNNIIVFGPSGIGKTEMAIQAVKKSKYNYIYLNLSVLEAPDLVGLPTIENGRTTYATPDFLPLDCKDTENILIVDEIDKAKDELQNPMLELFQFRSVNGKKLNIKSIIATGNLPNEHAKSRVISWALTNRCNIYKIGCDYEFWRKWAVTNNINPLIVGFLNHRSDLLLKPNTSGDPTAYCHPSPRSWTLAAYDIDRFDEYLKKYPEDWPIYKEDEDIDPAVNFKHMLVAGRVGLKAALDFKIWLKHYRFLGPDIDKLINYGTFPDENLMSLDRIMVFAIAGINEINKACKMQDKEYLDKVINNVCRWMNSHQVTGDQAFATLKSTLTLEFVEKYDLLSYQFFEDMFDKIGDAIDLL